MLHSLTLRFMRHHPEETAQTLERLGAEALREIMSVAPSDVAAGLLCRMSRIAAARCLGAMTLKTATAALAHVPGEHLAAIERDRGAQ